MSPPRTIAELVASPGTKIGERSADVLVLPEWTVDEEPQLSYTSLVCLAECLRELHWQRDLGLPLDGGELNATARSMSADFMRPVHVGVSGSAVVSPRRHRADLVLVRV